MLRGLGGSARWPLKMLGRPLTRLIHRLRRYTRDVKGSREELSESTQERALPDRDDLANAACSAGSTAVLVEQRSITAGLDRREEQSYRQSMATNRRHGRLPLLGLKELADQYGITRSSLEARRKRPDFPKPVAELACGPVWHQHDIDHYNRQDRRHPESEYQQILDRILHELPVRE